MILPSCVFFFPFNFYWNISCQSLKSVKEKQHLHKTCIQPEDKTAEELEKRTKPKPTKQKNLKKTESTVNALTPISNRRLNRNEHKASGKGDRKWDEKANLPAGVLHLNYSGFLKPDSLAKLNIQPGRITGVRDGAKTMGMTLCISAASKDKYQLESLAVTEIVILYNRQKGSTFLLWL